MSTRAERLRESLDKKLNKTEEHIERVEAGQIDSEMVTTAKNLKVEAEKMGETMWDTVKDLPANLSITQFILNALSDTDQPTVGDAANMESYKDTTGRDTEAMKQEVAESAEQGQLTSGQEMSGIIPSEIAAAVGVSKIAKIRGLADKWRKGGKLAKVSVAAEVGAVENLTADALSQNLLEDTKPGEKLDSKSLIEHGDSGKAATSAAIGAGAGTALVGGGLLVKDAFKGGKKLVGSISENLAETKAAIKAGSETTEALEEKIVKKAEDRFLDKFKSTERTDEDVSFTKRATRTAVRIAAKHGYRELEHTMRMFAAMGKDIGSEIFQEVDNLVRTKYKKYKGKFTPEHEETVAKEAMQNVAEKMKTAKPTSRVIDEDATAKMFDESETLKNTSSETRAKIVRDVNTKRYEFIGKLEDADGKVTMDIFTDPEFTKYFDLSGQVGERAIARLDDIVAKKGRISNTEARSAIHDIFDEVEMRSAKRKEDGTLDYGDDEIDEFLARQSEGKDQYASIDDELSGMSVKERLGDKDIAQLEADRKFFTQDHESFKNNYNSMTDGEKIELVDRFRELADLPKVEKHPETIALGDKINELGSKLDSLKLEKSRVESSGMSASAIKKELNKIEFNSRGIQKQIDNRTKEYNAKILDDNKFIGEIFKNKEMFDFYRQEVSDSLTNRLKDATLSHKNKKMVKQDIGSETATPDTPNRAPDSRTEAKADNPYYKATKGDTMAKKPKSDTAQKDIQVKADDIQGKYPGAKVTTIGDHAKTMKFDEFEQSVYDNIIKPKAEGATVVLREGIHSPRKNKNVSGQYNRDTKEIHLDEKLSKRKERAFIHEGLHRVTADAIDSDPKLYKELEDIIEVVKKETGSSRNWSTNPHELLAEFFSHADVNIGLKDVKLPQTLFEKVANFVKKVLGKNVDNTVGNRLNRLIDDIVSGKNNLATSKMDLSKDSINAAISSKIDGILGSTRKALDDTGILKVSEDGKVKVGKFETESLSGMLTDLGLANKVTYDHIKNFRAKMLGAMKGVDEVSKAINKVIHASGIDDKSLREIINGRVATAIANHGVDNIMRTNIQSIGKKYNIGNLEKIMKVFGQRGVLDKNNYANIDLLWRALPNKPKNRSGFYADIEKLLAKDSIEKLDPLTRSKLDSNTHFVNTLKSIEDLEQKVLGDKMQYGYLGFGSEFAYETRVAISKAEINTMKNSGQWKQVGDSNTFYRIDLEGNVSDGILPSKSRKTQGRIIEKDNKEAIALMKKDGIPYTVDKRTGDYRAYPDSKLQSEILGSVPASKLLAKKFKTLAEENIRRDVADNLTDTIKNQFSKVAKDGYEAVPEDIAFLYRKALGYKKDTPVFVNKQYKDILVGVKETLLYKGDSRLPRLVERIYKDTLKRFKKSVTVQSVSSIVNNFLVIPSTLKMNGISMNRVIPLMRKSHKQYNSFIESMEQYQRIYSKDGHKAAQKWMDNLRANNSDVDTIVTLLENGKIQSGADDHLIQLSNGGDMFSYGIDTALNKAGAHGGRLNKIISNLEMRPDSSIGSFFLNKFVMADLTGRVSLYNGLIEKGVSKSKAMKLTDEAFVDYTAPLPKPIRVLEEYGVPFVGWMYRMQLPIMKMIKNNPVDAAGIVMVYMMLDAMTGGKEGDGYFGNVKADSWFLHNAALDTNVFSMSPMMKGEVPSIKPQFMREAAGVAAGDKSIFELTGLNIR